MPRLHVLRVFTDADGMYGNPLGVFLEEDSIAENDHQAIATALGFSETVFVENNALGTLRLYTPGGELPFAGHPLVGTSWLLRQHGFDSASLRPPPGSVPTWLEDGLVWVRAPIAWCPSWSHLHVDDVEDVEQTREAPSGYDHLQLWSYLDEERGIVRARTFAPRYGVREDEACGSASMVLGAFLGRPLFIRHGEGSEIFVRPGTSGEMLVGGRVVAETVRELSAADIWEMVDDGSYAAAHRGSPGQ